jgi:hypothetical protein
MGGQGMSKYEEITLMLVIGLCLAVPFAFKTVKDKEEEYSKRLGPLLESGEKFLNEETVERLDKYFKYLDAFITTLSP